MRSSWSAVAEEDPRVTVKEYPVRVSGIDALVAVPHVADPRQTLSRSRAPALRVRCPDAPAPHGGAAPRDGPLMLICPLLVPVGPSLLGSSSFGWG